IRAIRTPREDGPSDIPGIPVQDRGAAASPQGRDRCRAGSHVNLPSPAPEASGVSSSAAPLAAPRPARGWSARVPRTWTDWTGADTETGAYVMRRGTGAVHAG